MPIENEEFQEALDEVKYEKLHKTSVSMEQFASHKFQCLYN